MSAPRPVLLAEKQLSRIFGPHLGAPCAASVQLAMAVDLNSVNIEPGTKERIMKLSDVRAVPRRRCAGGGCAWRL